MQRVAIIGSSGSGKSTLAVELGRVLDLPVIHLDRHYWRPGWVEPDESEWDAQHAELIAGDAWIIDGSYSRTIEPRLERADTVIFLDVPRWRAVGRVLTRWLRHRGSQRPDMGEGSPEKIDWAFLRWTWDYPKRSRPKALAVLEQARAAGKQVFHLTSDREAEELVARLRAERRAATSPAPTTAEREPRAHGGTTAGAGAAVRAAIYAWYRGEEADKGGETVEVQEERCLAYAEAAGYRVVAVYHETMSQPDEERTALRDLRALVYRRGVDLVLATKPDRIYIDPDRLLRFASDARLMGVQLEFLEMPVEVEQMLHGLDV